MASNDWLDRNTIAADRKLLICVLSFLASTLLLATGTMSEGTLAIIFLVSFIILLIALWVLVRQQSSERWRFQERKLLQSRWGIFGIAALGFGLGGLVYRYRGWVAWLWSEFRKIDKPEKWILVSLFLLGVMLGFFVVRNWSKNQQEFMTSLTAALGAAFLATIMGTLAGNRQAAQPGTGQTVPTAEASPAASPPAAVASPGASTAAVAPAARRGAATASPTGTPAGTASPAPASAGSAPAAGATPAAAGTPAATPARSTAASVGAVATAPLLDPVTSFAFYALGFTLSGTLNLIAFALLVAHYTRTQSLASRSVIDFLYGSDKAQAIDGYFLQNFEADPNYAKAKLVAALSAYREIIRKEVATRMNRRKERSDRPASPPPSKPLDYFELISIKTIPPATNEQMSPPASPPPGPLSDVGYKIVFRRLRERGSGEPDDRMTAEMFRVAISMRWLDNLEYVVTAGEYKQSFPYFGSVAGMSLLVRRTIVMDRDKYKKFRTGDFVDGKTPSQADQPRGLYDIDYLSYICVPMLSSLGKPEEQPLGVLHVDTKLFAYRKGELPPGSERDDDDLKEGMFRIVIPPDQDSKKKLDEKLREFEGYACDLYQENDPIVNYLENKRDVIIPLLELYKKCRTGAVNEPKPAA